MLEIKIFNKRYASLRASVVKRFCFDTFAVIESKIFNKRHASPCVLRASVVNPVPPTQSSLFLVLLRDFAVTQSAVFLAFLRVLRVSVVNPVPPFPLSNLASWRLGGQPFPGLFLVFLRVLRVSVVKRCI